MLRTVTATRYVTPLREGGSLPGIMEADDLGTYVVKFRGAGQGRKVLVAQWRGDRDPRRGRAIQVRDGLAHAAHDVLRLLDDLLDGQQLRYPPRASRAHPRAVGPVDSRAALDQLISGQVYFDNLQIRQGR